MSLESKDIRPVEGEVAKPVIFHVDQFGTQWEAMVAAKRKQDELDKFVKEAKALFKTLAQGASEFRMGNQKVASIVPGQLNMSKLEEEQPDLVAEFTFMVTKPQFDAVAFAKAHPKIWEEYRAKRLVFG